MQWACPETPAGGHGRRALRGHPRTSDRRRYGAEVTGSERDSLCPACGFRGLTEPPWHGDSPSDQICPSCGIQFGYDDAGRRTANFYAGWRGHWVVAGMPWWSTQPPPDGWSAEEQVRRLSE